MNPLHSKAARWKPVLVALAVFLSLVGGALALSAESQSTGPTVTVSQTARCVYEEGGYVMRGILTIMNTGGAPVTITDLYGKVQAGSDPRWVTIRQQALPVTSPSEVEAGGYLKITFVFPFSPTAGYDSYRFRTEVLAASAAGSPLVVSADQVFILPPAVTVPPTTVPPTTQPPTVPPTTPPTTVPPTTQPPTVPPTTLPPTGEPTPPASGRIVNIVENLSSGGDTVTVFLVVEDGTIPVSSLELMVHTFSGNAWRQEISQCISLGPLDSSSATEATPYLHTFSNVSLSGTPDYRVSVIWKDNASCSGSALDQILSSCYRVPAYDRLSTAAILLTMLIISSYYIQRWAKERNKVAA